LRRITIALFAAVTFLGAAGLGAQQPAPAPAPDTVTVSPQEALRARQRELLDRLARPVGQDTLDVRPNDAPDDAPPGLRAPARPVVPVSPTVELTGDTIVERLIRDLPGYQAVQYEAAQARFDAASRDLFLFADTLTKVTVRYDEQQVTADSLIVFNQLEEVVEARGRPVFTPRDGAPVQSQRLIVDTRTQEAAAFGAETEIIQGSTTWALTGDIPRIRSDLVYASHARFTSCDLEIPHYHFASDRIKIIRGSILVAMPARLYFADVPVFWIPFVVQSLATGRASGLLTPRFSVNDIVRTSGGYQRRISNVGFYWAMSDYTDATLALDWFSNNFTSLTGGLRYRWQNQFLQGTLNGRQFWRAEGGTEFSLNGQHSWQLSERTSMNGSLAYVSSTSFLRRNTFDPLEATQNITSSGGFTRRFDWGQLNVFASRSQSLSDDRVDLTLPRATLSMRPITLFPAPPGRAGAFNNITWSGGANLSRRTLDFPEQRLDRPFTIGLADQGLGQLAVNHSLGLGNLSFSQDLRLQEGSFRGVPRDQLSFFPGVPGEDPSLERVDIHRTTLDWSTGLSYQQTLIGATSLTPTVSLSGSALRSDTMELAQSFVSAPTRLNFGATLRSSLYGFFPGFGSFEAVRHRLSPSFSYTWSPEVEPTQLQRDVFGPLALQPQKLLAVNLSQTFEAKRRPPETPLGTPSALQPATETDVDAPADAAEAADLVTGLPGEPTRRQQGQVVTLLALHTSSVSYDFVRADSTGQFLQGFTTTRLRNEIGSDYLRGLTISVEHDLFRDSLFFLPGQGVPIRERSFAPHLSAVNLRFAVNARSGIFRWLGLVDETTRPTGTPMEDGFEDEDPFAEGRSVTDEASIMPGRTPPTGTNGAQPRRREWNMGVTYALNRPREEIFRERAQTLRFALNTQPTQNWLMSWRTSYDLNGGQFSDHIVTLTRELHRWQANFDFLQTATGNWAFRFEVSLRDNRDLRFDYDQRSVDNRQLGFP